MTVPVTAVVFLLATICRVNGYSVFEGERLKNDKLLHHSDHVKAPILFIRTSDVAFPKYFEPDDNIITAIEIIDNSQNGASAEVDYGGVGFNYANVHLRSALWGGFNFTIDIYGIDV